MKSQSFRAVKGIHSIILEEKTQGPVPPPNQPPLDLSSHDWILW